MRNNMNKTNKVEITKDMSLEDIAYAEIHNKTVDTLEDLDCFSVYTTKMEVPELTRDKYGILEYDTIKVMLNLPLELVRNAIDVCKEVKEKYAEEYGKDEWGLTPFDVLVSAYDKTDLMHYPEDVVETETEKFE